MCKARNLFFHLQIYLSQSRAEKLESFSSAEKKYSRRRKLESLEFVFGCREMFSLTGGKIYISAATKNVLQPQKKTNQLSQCFQIFLAFSVSQNCHGQSIFPAPEFWVPSIGVFLGPFKFFKTPPRFLKFLQFLKCFQFDCNPPVALRGNILMETDIIWSS